MNSNSTDTKQVRRFGLCACILFGCLSGLGILKGKSLPALLFGSLSLLGLGFIVAPSLLKPAYVAWIKIGKLLGKVITTVVLTLSYFFVITPAAFIKCVFGGSPLPVMPDKEASTYWVTRSEPAQTKERFLKRY